MRAFSSRRSNSKHNIHHHRIKSGDDLNIYGRLPFEPRKSHKHQNNTHRAMPFSRHVSLLKCMPCLDRREDYASDPKLCAAKMSLIFIDDLSCVIFFAFSPSLATLSASWWFHQPSTAWGSRKIPLIHTRKLYIVFILSLRGAKRRRNIHAKKNNNTRNNNMKDERMWKMKIVRF